MKNTRNARTGKTGRFVVIATTSTVSFALLCGLGACSQVGAGNASEEQNANATPTTQSAPVKSPNPTMTLPEESGSNLAESSLSEEKSKTTSTRTETSARSAHAPQEPKPAKDHNTWKKTSEALKLAPDSTVASQEPERASEVALDETVDAGSKAHMSVKRIESTHGEAKGIGEISGPATLLEISITNDDSKELNLERAQVRLFYGDEEQPAALLTDSRTTLLPSTLPKGEDTTAVFIFSAAVTGDDKVLVEFESGNTEKIQQLVGEVGS